MARRSQTWRRFTWGNVPQEVLVEQTFGEGSSARTTRWDYHANSPFPVKGSQVPLKCVIHPTDYWERIDEYDASGRPLVVVHQFLNAPTNALASEARRFDFDYTPVSGTQDDGSLRPHLPRRTDETLLNVPISTAYTIIEPYQTRTIRCPRPGLAWNDPSNLVTTNKYYDASAGAFEHRLRSVLHPDGRREAYLYAAAGSVVDQKTYTYTDVFRRSHTAVDLSGRTNTVQYACCGLDLIIDHDGTQTQYLYDGLGRGIGSCVLSYNPVLTTTNVLDAAGRVLAKVRNGGVTAIVQRQTAYDLAGEVVSEINALGGTTTYAETKVNGQTVRTTTYPDNATRIETSAQDGSLIEVAGTAASPLRYLYGVDDTGEDDAQSNPILLSSAETSVDGLRSWQRVYPDGVNAVTTQSQTTYGSSGSRAVTLTHPDGSSTVNAYSYGRLVSTTRKDSGGNQVTQTSYAYDAHGRVTTTTDARNGATTFVYNNADQVATNTAPILGTGEAPQATVAFFDSSGRTTGQRLPDGTTTTNFHSLAGLLQKTYGSRTYPVEYTYDAQGRMRTMITWQQFNEATGQGISGGATTRWNYDTYQGWLKSKDYPDASAGSPPAQEGTGGPVYTNKVSGRLATRVWKRGVTTGYTYNTAGELATIDYSDSTPDVVHTYDRRGRRATVVRGSITTSLTYNDADQALTEAYTGGTLAGLNMAWTYDSALRRDTVTAKNGGTTQQAATYQYDTAGRFWKVSDSPYVGTYGYHANSMLISSLGYTNGVGTGQGLATSRAYDRLNRLTSISSRPYGSAAPSLPAGFQYQYNAANQRTRAGLGDGTYWVYEYDALGQVTAGRRYWGDGTPVAGQDFTYGFDEIGNRQSTGGRASSVSSYTNNRLNQITGRSVAPYVDVLGVGNPTANVTVRVVGSTTYTSARKGEYFHHALNIPNSTNVYPSIEVKSLYGATQAETNEVFVAAATESPTYDADGNLTADGRWTYTWDGENRLVQMIRDTDSPSGARQRLLFEYDHQGRRIRKTFSTYSGGWQEQSDLIFLYDGWNLVAELDANASNAKVRTYVWGTDLSGTITGAGGVGGLLWVNNHQSTFEGKTLPTGVQYAAYDGNGNVSALVKAADGSVTARYDYGPFAEPIRASGPLAKANPIRFSTKYTDYQSGLVYYGYRYYNPSTWRWPSRDPIAEPGFRQCALQDVPDDMRFVLELDEDFNAYGFVSNDSIDQTDLLGLAKKRSSKKPAKNPCDGYKKFIPTPKCMCNCKLIPDPYPAHAEKVCNGFMEKYDWSDKAPMALAPV